MRNQLTLYPKRVFLIDSLGAWLTSFMVGIVLEKFEGVFGMPKEALYPLACLAFAYSIYSACCYFFTSKNWSPYLKVIAAANLVYCCITMALVFYFYTSLTMVGLIYFLGEVLIILGLVLIEIKTISLHAAE